MFPQEGKMDEALVATGFGNRFAVKTKKSNCFLNAGSVSENIR
jgi:hypothetical protein